MCIICMVDVATMRPKFIRKAQFLEIDNFAILHYLTNSFDHNILIFSSDERAAQHFSGFLLVRL